VRETAVTSPLFDLVGFIDRHDVMWDVASLEEVNPLLATSHYLGPMNAGGAQMVIAGRKNGRVVGCQVWRQPTTRHLPPGGTWLELSRWCLTPELGENAGSRMDRYAKMLLRSRGVLTGVSYSDPSHGHTGALYKACNWHWAPTWQRLRPPPTGAGSWDGITQQSVKDRWVLHVTKRDPQREILRCQDASAFRVWLAAAPAHELALARRSPYMRDLMSGQLR
jgi:hypothetical protein